MKAKRAKAMKAAKAVAPPKAMKTNGAKATNAIRVVALPNVMTTKGTISNSEWTHVGTLDVRECWVGTECLTKKPPVVRVWGKLS